MLAGPEVLFAKVKDKTLGAFSKIQFDSLRWISWWTDPNLGDICTAAAQNRKRGRGIFRDSF